MLIRKLTLENFIPFYGKQTVTFPTDKVANVLVIFGENTKGKTSLLHAIHWVLYGRTLDTKKMGARDILNKKAREEGDYKYSVELLFEQDGEEVTMTRLASVAEKHGVEGRVEFIVTVGEKNLSNSEAIEYVQRIAPVETSRFFLFDGELLKEYEQLMDASSESSRRIKQSIEDILGVPGLVKASEIAGLVLRDLRGERTKRTASDKALASHKKLLADAEAQIDSIEDQQRAIKILLEENQKTLKETHSQIATNESLQSKYGERERLRTKITTLSQQNVDQLELAQGALTNVWKTVIKEYVDGRRKDQRSLLEKARENERATQTCARETEGLQTLDESGICPVCKQPVDAKHQESLAQELALLEAKMIELKAEKAQIDLPESLWENLFSKLESAPSVDLVESSRSMIDKNELEIVRLSTQIKGMQEDLENFNNRSHERLVKIEVQVGTQVASDEQTLDKLDADLKVLHEQQVKLDVLIKESSDDETRRYSERVDVGVQLKKIFDKAITTLRDDLSVTVEEKASEAFCAMTTRPEDYAGLKINENYGLNILAQDGRVVPARSAGAEQIVALALIDGLNRTGKAPGPVIMDTPFGRLDRGHRANIMTYMPESSRQFGVFVHSGEMEESDEILNTLNPRIGAKYRIQSRGPLESYLEQL